MARTPGRHRHAAPTARAQRFAAWFGDDARPHPHPSLVRTTRMIMSEVTRRKLPQGRGGGAGAALLPVAWTAAARAGSAAPPEVLAADDLALWYDESAGTDWLRALPIGNGRLGAMVFGNVDTERLQLNEDTVWAGGPYDPSNPRGAASAGGDPAAGLRRPVEPGAGS